MTAIIAIGFIGFVFIYKRIQKKYKVFSKNRFKVINKMYDE